MHKNEKTIDELLNEFEAAKGKDFVFTGEGRSINPSWAGEILGVDRENMMIIGEKGEFPISMCKIKEEQPPSLKEFHDRKRDLSQGSFFA